MSQQETIINQLLAQNKAFALFLKPQSDIPELIIGKTIGLDAALSMGSKCFAFAPFQENKQWESKAIVAEDNCVGWDDIEQFSKQLKTEIDFLNSGEYNSLVEKGEYIQLLEKTVETLDEHDFRKVIISRPVIAQIDGKRDAGKLFVQLVKMVKSAFRYIVFIPKIGVWMGATPELLLNLQNGIGKTISLAGTLPVDSSTNWSEKELEEQQIVTDYIQMALENAGASAITQSERHAVVAGTVQHLRTNFSFEINKQCTLKSLIKQLHPTPAIGGLPRNKAIDFINENELYDREYYAGFLGKIDSENSAELYVNLRCMKLLAHQAVIYVGGGITAQSNPEKEWEETQLKALTLLQVIKQVNQQ
ncbi:isochorismate synthase [Prolixibacteraceae bacterium JC049]|nr:isochorismate synthase [Prolixibacteraceae bacterium JC049]